MNWAIKISLLFAGLFLLAGMLTGIWKYAATMRSETRQAPVYVDIAHRASFFYSFACLVIARLIEFSPFSPTQQVLIVGAPILYFALTILGYVKEGFLNRTKNIFSERNFITTWFMYGLIVAEVGGLILILYGFIATQFFVKPF